MRARKILITGGSGFIGRNLINQARKNGHILLSIDVTKPKLNMDNGVWLEGSIMNKELIARSISQFSPEIIIHMAATTIQESENEADYDVNIQGTRNIYETILEINPNVHLIFFSTQHVNADGSNFSLDLQSLSPLNTYGKSKLQSEIDIIASGLTNWTIVRPTLIWGSEHEVLQNGLWKWMDRRLYFHPRNDSATKCYGYVLNTVHQILRIVDLCSVQESLVNRKVFYLGDSNMLQIEWINRFSRELTGKPAKTLPKSFLKALGLVGDLVKTITGITPPIYSARYRNLIASRPVDLTNTFEVLGVPEIETNLAIRETVNWYKERNH